MLDTINLQTPTFDPAALLRLFMVERVTIKRAARLQDVSTRTLFRRIKDLVAFGYLERVEKACYRVTVKGREALASH